MSGHGTSGKDDKCDDGCALGSSHPSMAVVQMKEDLVAVVEYNVDIVSFESLGVRYSEEPVCPCWSRFSSSGFKSTCIPLQIQHGLK